jgi:ECF transporter S component (folate family)
MWRKITNATCKGGIFMPKRDPPALYSAPFFPSYWRSAARELESLRILALAALFVAIHVALRALFIPVGENLRIYFTFFVTALSAMICGPVIALISGFIGDILGYIVTPSGIFFPGYTLSSMLGGLTFALFLYRARISVLRILLSKLCVNLFVNMLLGSVWSAVQFGKGYYSYLAKSAAKNILLLPFEVILLTLFFQLAIPTAVRAGLMPRQPTRRIPWI